ncbi:MAG: phosphoribosyltransferase family protein [Balneolaceae bacterium]
MSQLNFQKTQTDMPAERKKITLMDRSRIERTVKRIAYQIAEKAKEKRICLVGLNERGLVIAGQILKGIEKACDNEAVLISLDVSRARQEAERIRKEYDFEDSVLLLVDDVIFTGETMFTALQYLLDRPSYTVYTAVLIDRGHRTLPVASEFIGMEIPTKPKEHVEMTVREGSAEEVFLYKK